jgi:hypothetical protein
MFRDSFAAFLKKEWCRIRTRGKPAGMVSREVWKKTGDMGFYCPRPDESTAVAKIFAMSRSCAKS